MHEIPYEERNVEDSQEVKTELLERTGHEMVPALISKNNDVVIGFDEARLKEIYS